MPNETPISCNECLFLSNPETSLKWQLPGANGSSGLMHILGTSHRKPSSASVQRFPAATEHRGKGSRRLEEDSLTASGFSSQFLLFQHFFSKSQKCKTMQMLCWAYSQPVQKTGFKMRRALTLEENPGSAQMWSMNWEPPFPAVGEMLPALNGLSTFCHGGLGSSCS